MPSDTNHHTKNNNTTNVVVVVVVVTVVVRLLLQQLRNTPPKCMYSIDCLVDPIDSEQVCVVVVVVSMNTIDTHLHTSLSCRWLVIYIYVYMSCDLYEQLVRGGSIQTSSGFSSCSETRQIGVRTTTVCCVCVCFGRVFFSGPIFECHLEIESALSLQYEPYIHTLNRYDVLMN